MSKKHKSRKHNKVFSANSIAVKHRAMDLEISRQILKHDEQYTVDFDAMVLYTLMAHYGWKKKRLRKFWNAFVAEHKALREFYQMEGVGDNGWLAHHKLKEIGVDVHQWYKEDESNED